MRTAPSQDSGRAGDKKAVRKALDRSRSNAVASPTQAIAADPPADLEQQIRKRIDGTAESWDSALHGLATAFVGNDDEATS